MEDDPRQVSVEEEADRLCKELEQARAMLDSSLACGEQQTLNESPQRASRPVPPVAEAEAEAEAQAKAEEKAKAGEKAKADEAVRKRRALKHAAKLAKETEVIYCEE